MTTIPYFFNQCLDKKRLKQLILWSLSYQDEYKTLQLIEEFKTLGFRYATYAGVSLSIDDLRTPPKKQSEVLDSEIRLFESIQSGVQGNRTAIENLQMVVDTWHRTSETVKQHVIDYFEATNILNPVYMMAFSGARGNVSQVRQLVGMRGLMADPKGDIIGFAIRSNFREGLTITEYMISCYGARKGVVDTALRTADAGYLTRRLVDVAQHILVQQGSCGTLRGIEVRPLIDYGKTLVPLRDRLVGRVLAQDIFADEICIGKRNEPITNNIARELSQYAVDPSLDENSRKIFVRSPLTCELDEGVCQLCYGWSLSQNSLVTIGEAVGVIAGQSIGEPGTQLTMRTFHTGGVFTGDVQEEFRAPHGGIIHYESQFPGLLVRTPYGQIAFLVRAPGTLVIFEKKKRTQLPVPMNMALFLREGETVQTNQLLGFRAEEGGQTNERIETRKIVFSQFPGEVFFQDVQLKSLTFPIKNKTKTKREKRKDKKRPPNTYILTHQVGTLWILAGASIGQTDQILPIYKTSGQLVDTKTLIRSQAIFQTFEGLLKFDSENRFVNPTQNTNGFNRMRNQNLPFQDQGLNPISPKFIFQPLIQGTSHKIQIHRETNLLSFYSKDEILLWPHHPQITQLRRDFSTKKDHQFTFLYYHTQYCFSSSSGFFWYESYSADIRKKHGHGFVLPRMIQSKKPWQKILWNTWPFTNVTLDSDSSVATKPSHQKFRFPRTKGFFRQNLKNAHICIGSWCQKGTRILGKENLQGNIQWQTAPQGGIFKGDPTLLQHFDHMSRVNVRYRLNPQAAHSETSRISQLMPQFPFSNRNVQTFVADEKEKDEFCMGWGYLPMLGVQTDNPEFFGHRIVHEAIFLRVKSISQTNVFEQKVWSKLDLPSNFKWNRFNKGKRKWFGLSRFRQRALARHPQILTFLPKKEHKRIHKLFQQFHVITFEDSNGAYFVTSPRELREFKTRRLQNTYTEWHFSPLFGQKKQEEIPVSNCVHPKFLATYYLALLYQPISEYPLDRIRTTQVQIGSQRSFENCSKNLQRPSVHRIQTSFFNSCEKSQSIYQLFVPQTKTVAKAQRNFSRSEHVWIKQFPSRVMPLMASQQYIKPFLFPSNTFFTSPFCFGCRFLLQTNKPSKHSDIQLFFEKPRPLEEGWQIGFTEPLRMNSTYDDILKAEEALVLFSDLVARRKKYEQFTGETIVMTNQNCLVIPEKDIRTYSIDSDKLTINVGDVLRYGDEIAPGIGLPESGQILEITSTTLRVRRGQPILFYNSGALHVQANACIPRGHPLVTLSYQRLITGDIVQGIPKVEQFFEGTSSSDNLPQLLQTTFRTLKQTHLPSIAFQKSTALVQQKIIENIQKVYLSQGVTIDDKHFEIIVRRMTSSVKIIDPGETGLFRNEIFPLPRLEKINAGTMGKKAVYEPIIVGISAAALNSESFLSAASFQETTRILTRDTLAGKTDFLKGLKERVIVGDLIPAGTGLGENILYGALIKESSTETSASLLSLPSPSEHVQTSEDLIKMFLDTKVDEKGKNDTKSEE